MDTGDALEARFDTGAAGALPQKVAGHHRWVAAASYALTEGEAHRIHGEGEPVQLDHENRTAITVGCWDCGHPYAIAKDRPCEGDLDPQVMDPADWATDLPPAGSLEMRSGQVDRADLDKVMLASGFGVQPVVTADEAGTEQLVQCLVSLVGRRNRSEDEFHHLYMLTPSSMGLFMAQMMNGIVTMGPRGQEALAVFQQRMNELVDSIT